jgi:enoyl-CoA hydratase/carnithine racemase
MVREFGFRSAGAIMASDNILCEKDGAVGRLIFNNPARHNAVSLEMWEAAEQVLHDLSGDDEVRVIVVTGAGEKAFVSGADISKFGDERATAEAVAGYNVIVSRALHALSQAAKPTIAMIRGYCIGGGVGLAICCDLRFCTEGSRFGIPAARLGLGYGIDGVRRLVDLVGPAFTKEIFFTARQFSAQEAAAMGLVNRVVPEAELDRLVQDTADMIAGNAPLTVRSIKRIVDEVLADESARDIEACNRLVRACFDSQDYIEGRRAFVEKRKPVFVGR